MTAGASDTAGKAITDDEADTLWDPWTPTEVFDRLAEVSAPWCVAAGWALELFTPTAARAHHDLEIALPAGSFAEVAATLPGFDWDVAGDGRLWPYPEKADEHFQTWLRERASGHYRLDVFREPHEGNLWKCRRDTSITLPYTDVILRSANGIPYAAPEVVLLFKAKHLRKKDQLDFQRVLPELDDARRARLGTWLERVHPGHRWISSLAEGPPRDRRLRRPG